MPHYRRVEDVVPWASQNFHDIREDLFKKYRVNVQIEHGMVSLRCPLCEHLFAGDLADRVFIHRIRCHLKYARILKTRGIWTKPSCGSLPPAFIVRAEEADDYRNSRTGMLPAGIDQIPRVLTHPLPKVALDKMAGRAKPAKGKVVGGDPRQHEPMSIADYPDVHDQP